MDNFGGVLVGSRPLSSSAAVLGFDVVISGVCIAKHGVTASFGVSRLNVPSSFSYGSGFKFMFYRVLLQLNFARELCCTTLVLGYVRTILFASLYPFLGDV